MGELNEVIMEARNTLYMLRTRAYEMQSSLRDLSVSLHNTKEGRVADYYRMLENIEMISKLSASAKHDVNKLMHLGVHVGDFCE